MIEYIISKGTRKMKRLFPMILAAIMLLAVMAFPAYADESARFYLEGPSSAKVGDRITISLFIDGEYKVNTLNLRVYFDNTSFSYVGRKFGQAYYDTNDEVGPVYSECRPTSKGNAVSFAMMMIDEPMHAVGKLVDLEFEVLATASPNADFMVEVRDFGYMPIGASNATPVAHTENGLSMTLSGGSGTGTTPMPIATPRPISPTATPAGDSKTEDPSHSDSKETPAPTDPAVTEGPSDTDDPTTTEGPSDPDATPAPDTAPTGDPKAPSFEDGKGTDWKKIGIYGGLGAVLAAAVVVLITQIVKKKKNGKDED